MTQLHFDRRDQYEKIVAGLFEGEEVIAVYDTIGVGTGFIGLTSKRIILQDNTFARRKIAVTSILYGRVMTVSFVANRSVVARVMSRSSIHISAGGRNYEVYFRGDAKAQEVHDIILRHMMG